LTDQRQVKTKVALSAVEAEGGAFIHMSDCLKAARNFGSGSKLCTCSRGRFLNLKSPNQDMRTWQLLLAGAAWQCAIHS